MNDQPSKLPFNEYFSFDEYDIVPLEPGKASGDTLTVRLNQEGLNRVIGDLSALLERLYRPPCCIRCYIYPSNTKNHR